MLLLTLVCSYFLFMVGFKALCLLCRYFSIGNLNLSRAALENEGTHFDAWNSGTGNKAALMIMLKLELSTGVYQIEYNIQT